MEKFSVISIAIDAPTFDLFAYYNVKMDILVFLEMGERLYILWSANDHEIPDKLRSSWLSNTMNLLQIRFGHPKITLALGRCQTF